MKKSVFLLILFLTGNLIFSQKMMTRNGLIRFEANVPSFEEVTAINKTVSAILDTSNGNLAALALVKAFQFKVPLMEEHFNENYIESSKFPKATFKGKISNFNFSKLTLEKVAYDLDGEMTLHGVTKKIKTKLTLKTENGKVFLSSDFIVKPQDFDIEIPNLVKNKIAENVTISVNFALEKN